MAIHVSLKGYKVQTCPANVDGLFNSSTAANLLNPTSRTIIRNKLVQSHFTLSLPKWGTYICCACVRVIFCVIGCSRNKPSPPLPPPPGPPTSQPGPPPPPQPAVPPPSAAAAGIGLQHQQQQPPQPAGTSAGPVSAQQSRDAEETDDTMKNLRKTFAGIFGNMWASTNLLVV